ncbi:MAG: GTPase ObgE [Candidatus Vogelbacteria bacterium]|nr:GTPase ObgE [Candidatus Vogelbacteria bacterium]
MLLDEVKIKVIAGHGGRGAVAFNNLKMADGPTGGNGGKGASVIFQGVSDLGALAQFRYQKDVVADNGGPGHASFVDGPDGENLVLKIPVGTVIHNLTTQKDAEMTTIGQQILIAKGGKAGRGNFKFRSSTNTTPKEFQPGLPGESFELELELKMIADVGFVGLPNVGKSTLLNLLTNAKSRVAKPNLGVYYDLVIADIPGLIEGASEGKGLGHKFLRHVERTKTLFHLVSAESADIKKDYETIRAELKAHNPELIEKPEYLIITKTDTVTDAELKKLMVKAKKLNPEVMALSIIDDASLEPVKKVLNKIADAKKA